MKEIEINGEKYPVKTLEITGGGLVDPVRIAVAPEKVFVLVFTDCERLTGALIETRVLGAWSTQEAADAALAKVRARWHKDYHNSLEVLSADLDAETPACLERFA